MNTPQAIESEKKLLGALLLNSNLIIEINPQLSSKDFHEDEHQEIFDAMKRLYETRGFFDAASIADEMTIDGDYVFNLASQGGSSQNIKAYADIISEESIQRQLMSW